MDVDLVRELDSVYAPSGRESPMSEYLSEHFADRTTRQYVDEVGNYVGIFGKEGAERKVLIDAHIDEVPARREYIFRQDGDTIYGKSFDNRLGVATAVKALDQYAPQDTEVRFVGSANEETGGAGATYANGTVGDVDVAFILDTAPLEVPYWDPVYKDAHVIVTAGPEGERTPTEELVIACAEELGIPYQVVPTDERQVTNGKDYTKAKENIVIEVPIHFMHNSNFWERESDGESWRHPSVTDDMVERSHDLLGDAYNDGTDLPEIARLSDVENAYQLLRRVLERIDELE